MADDDKPNFQQSQTVFGFFYLFVFISLFLFFLNSAPGNVVELPYSSFASELKAGHLNDLVIKEKEITGKIVAGAKSGKLFMTQRVDPQLAEKLFSDGVSFSEANENNLLITLAGWVLPLFVFFIIYSALLSRAGGQNGMGPGLMSIERSKAKMYVEQKVKVTFTDVAGVDEAKDELKEVVQFLKEPERYRRLGGHLPKGILLVGPPGTGKTLLARAVAGEAGVAFFSISGSEFVEMFVGVGAARVRDLFAQAQQKAPCIIFIDELDALGKARGISPVTGTHDEKEQTLNQLLVELDGFDPMQGVVLLAATNRPEILDQALLRAGRFDRHVLVDRPDRIGRVQILQVHLKGVTHDVSAVDLEQIASATPGFTGADLANLVNEAVLLAVRRDAETVQTPDFFAAIERVVAGLEKKNRLLNLKERKVVAFHETGHALVSLAIPGMDPVQKVSIIPRGIGALGYTLQRPIEDRFLMSKAELENKMTVLLGGRASELIVFDEMSTGAADDLVKATDIARSMVTRYGMSQYLGPVTYEPETNSFLQGWHETQPRQYSEETAREIDSAVRVLVENASKRAIAILMSQRAVLDLAATKLLAKETLTGEELLELIALGGADRASATGAPAPATTVASVHSGAEREHPNDGFEQQTQALRTVTVREIQATL